MKARFGLIAATAALLTALGTAPVSAGRPYACTYSSANGGEVTVDLLTTDYALIYVVGGGEITVHFDEQPPPDTDCGDATTANTSLITVLGSSGDDLIKIDDRAIPANIEMDIRGRDGHDQVWFLGSEGADTYRFGVAEGSLSGDRDATGSPTIAFRSVADFWAFGHGSADVLTGSPGGAFDGPFPRGLVLYGAAGVDKLVGGTARDILEGGSRGDDLRGKAGPDDLWGRNGDDALNGGSGEDYCKAGRGDDTRVNCELP